MKLCHTLLFSLWIFVLILVWTSYFLIKDNDIVSNISFPLCMTGIFCMMLEEVYLKDVETMLSKILKLFNNTIGEGIQMSSLLMISIHISGIDIKDTNIILLKLVIALVKYYPLQIVMFFTILNTAIYILFSPFDRLLIEKNPECKTAKKEVENEL